MPPAPESIDTATDAEVGRLITAAFAVMERDGFGATTVEAILSEAGLARRAFYRHFDSKDALLLAMYGHQAERAAGLMRERSADGTPTERLERWVDEALKLVSDPRRASRTLLLQAEAARVAQERPEFIAAVTQQTFAPLVAILRAGRADGAFPRTEPEVDARSINAVLWERIETQVRAGRLEPEAIRAHVLRFCLPALGVTELRAESTP